MSQFAFVVTLPANGNAPDGDDLATALNEIKSYLNAGNIGIAELGVPTHRLIVGPFRFGDGNGDVTQAGVTWSQFAAIPSNGTATIVKAWLAYKTDQTGSPTATLEIKQGASSTDLLTAQLDNSAAGTATSTIDFVADTLAANTLLEFQVSVSAGGGSDVARHVSAWLEIKMDHTAA